VPKILVVEDNDLNRQMIVRRLEHRGFEVVTADDGPSALTQVEATWPDLVLMDIQLPKMDGWDVARRLKENPTTSYVPIVALTANDLPTDRARAEAMGFDGFESKPIDLERVIATIESLIGR